MNMFEREHYSVECSDASDVAVMRGVMRLASPSAYESVFAPLRARIAAGKASTIDLRDVTFMNSSGIRALAGIVLAAKASGAGLKMIVNERIPWQKKTVASFQLINPGVSVELVR
jgi:hypothetical protein